MNRYIIIALLLFSTSCSPSWLQGQKGSSCSVEQLDGGALVSCTDGTEAFIASGADGQDGTDGLNGSDGLDGTGCQVETLDGGAMIECEDGSSALVVNGLDGLEGQDGTDGLDGTSCTLSDVDGGAYIYCEDGKVAFIADGHDGLAGEDGSSCSSNDVDGGVLISCDDGSSAFVADGLDGIDGQDGLDGADAIDSLFVFATTLAGKTNSILDIRMFDGNNNPQGRCTGTKTTNNTVVTASHCFDQNTAQLYFLQELNVVGQGGTPHPLASSGRDVVEVAGVNWSGSVPGLSITTAYNVDVGELVGNISLPLDIAGDPQITMGWVTDDNLNTSFNNDPFWHDAFMADYAAAGGSSGSPVFNEQGEWVGIHVGGFSNSLELSIALPFE